MTYQPGGQIDENDFNTIINTLNPIFGVGSGNSGYGGNSISVPISGNISLLTPGTIVQNEHWITIRNIIADLSNHQGTTLSAPIPNLNRLENGDLVLAHNDTTPNNVLGELNSSVNLSLLNTNRLNVNALNTTISASKLASTRTTPWTFDVRHDFNVQFSSGDHARYFFNTGGQIRIGASYSGGTPKLQNISWTELLSPPRTPFIFNHVNYYALTTTPTLIYNVSGTSIPTMSPYFQPSFWQIYVVASPPNISGNGDKGNIIYFTSYFRDVFVSASGQPSDIVDGILTSTISERRSTSIFNISSPVYTTTTSL